MITLTLLSILFALHSPVPGLTTCAVQEVWVPFFGIADVVEVAATRNGVVRSESLMSFGSTFSDVQWDDEERTAADVAERPGHAPR